MAARRMGRRRGEARPHLRRGLEQSRGTVVLGVVGYDGAGLTLDTERLSSTPFIRLLPSPL